MPKIDGNSIVRFGLFEANLQSGELRRHGQKVRLQEQPFQVLALLLEKPGEVVTREELRARLWLADTFVDFDHGLNAAIKRLRDALGDSAENPRFIETLARRGYRFIAPVEASRKEPAQPPSPRRHWLILTAAASVLVTGAIAGWVVGRKSIAAVNPEGRRLTGNAPNDPVWGAAVSPDAKYLAFADKSGFFLRVLASGETHALPEQDNLRTHGVTWFPDGTRALATRRELPDRQPSLWSVSVLSGTAHKLIDDGDQASVSPDGSSIAFVRGEYSHQEVWVMDADGEHPRKLVGAGGGGEYGSVTWSPDGKHIAYMHHVYRPTWDDGDVSIEVFDLAAKSDTTSFESRVPNVVLSDSRLWNGLAWTPDNRLIYSLGELPSNRTDSNLWAQKIDPNTFQPTRTAVRLTSGPDGKARLALSADGKRLTYLRFSYSPHIYVAEVGRDRTLGPLQRLSLDERGNYPYDWTFDGKCILFRSDRDGVFHLFRQALDQPAPDLLVGGDNNVLMARMDPHGTAVQYVLTAPPNDPSSRMRLMRMPVSGGVPQLVLSEPAINNFQCARRHSNVCVFSQYVPGSLTFYTFDSASGQKTLLWKIQEPEWTLLNWSLSPDGTTLALAKVKRTGSPSQIRLVHLDGTDQRTVNLDNWFSIDYLDWAADGQSLWANAVGPAGTASLLNVALSGKVTSSLRETEMILGWAIPSPDGRRVALWRGEQSANVWLLQGF